MAQKPPPPQPQYVTELNDNDVELGRGSGPNDRKGNIHFRALCKDRKIAYIEAKSRDEKGRIASDIVFAVKNMGGRFLKRLSAEQVKKVGQSGEKAVYEVADEPTILEKTKQTLRQNRADFVAKVEKEVGRAPVVGAYPIQRKGYDKQTKVDAKKTEITIADINFDPIPFRQHSRLDSSGGMSSSSNSALLFLAELLGSSDKQGLSQPPHYESGISALSIEDMSVLLYDALDKRSKGMADSDQLYQSILNECSADEYMAEQLVSTLLTDSKSEKSNLTLTDQQKAALLRYEQRHEHNRMIEQQLHQQQQQLAQQHHFGQEQLPEAAATLFSTGSVFSSLIRQYNDHNINEQNQFLQQPNFFTNENNPTVSRRLVRRATFDGGEQIEPANYLDEPMSISYQAAKELTRTLGGSSFSLSVNSKSSSHREFSGSSSRNRKRHGSLDSSLQSLMSMSISEITYPGPCKREGSRGTLHEVKIKEEESDVARSIFPF
jgi:hypothetical protein